MCCGASFRGGIALEMRLELLLLTCVVRWCVGVRLSPLENNDRLQDITNLYVAEWQWESWPIKQGSSEVEGRSPSQRRNVALWKESSGSAWYLFGGQGVNGNPRKVYSDIWKFTVKTRAWKRLFPAQVDVKTTNVNKTSGIVPYRANFFDEAFDQTLQSVILCGGLGKSNQTKVKKIKSWSGYRRKTEEEEPEDRLTSLAVYSPKGSKSNIVWQMDARKKLWTTYVCCCDTTPSGNGSLTSNSSLTEETPKAATNLENKPNMAKGDGSPFNTKINKAEDETDDEQQHLKMSALKNKKKKINQTKVGADKLLFKKDRIEKRGSSKGKADETKQEGSGKSENKTVEGALSTPVNVSRKDAAATPKVTKEEGKTGKPDKMGKVKMASEFCPEFPDSGTPVTWCDGHEALITTDISSPQLTLWLFNLTTSHWSQLQVASNGVEWPACSRMDSVRYAGNEEEVYIICSRGERANKTEESDLSKIPSKDNFNEKSVFRVSYSERVLQDLGSIRLNSFFNSPEGERVWRNESEAVLRVMGGRGNETVLVLAYLDMVDLWVLSRDPEGKEGFHLVEKIWRGSALKWFDKYNAALYSMQFVSESGSSETILLANPRKIGAGELWPRERGRFIIRVFRNENLKNQSFENRTREQNLTYELLQSDYKPTGSENQISHVYSLKVLVFFGISLAIFSVFGITLFLKRCVNCPPRIVVRNECHKSPLVIRYSVIPDDLLYPVA